MIMNMSSATNPGFGIWDEAWHLAIRVKYMTCEQNWDFPGPKFGTLIVREAVIYVLAEFVR